MKLLVLVCLLHTSLALGRAPGKAITPHLIPGVPSAYQASARFQNNYLAGVNAARERQAAEDRSHSSSSLESAARSELMVTKDKFYTEEAATLELSRARKIELLNNQAQTVLESTQQVLNMIPEITRRAVDRAVKDVESETFIRLNREVAQVVSAASGSEALAKHLAADAAQAAALPYQQGKLQAQQTMLAYAEKGQELAVATTELKGRAMKIAEASQPLQRAGDIVPAQQLQMEAHDLLDKAQQMEDQARALTSTASQIQQGLQAYDDAAQAAAAYGAYKVNPVAVDGSENVMPRPPFPLVLPKLGASPGATAPAPAPAPALAPGSEPAPGPAASPAASPAR